MTISTSYIDKIVNGPFTMTDLVRERDEESFVAEFTSEFDDEPPTTVKTEQDPEVRVELLEMIVEDRVFSLVSMLAELPSIAERHATLYNEFVDWLKVRAWHRHMRANGGYTTELYKAWHEANEDWAIDSSDPMHDKFEDYLGWAYDDAGYGLERYGAEPKFVEKCHRLSDDIWRTRAGRAAEAVFREWLDMEAPEDITEREAWLRDILPKFTAACWRAGDTYHEARREKRRKEWFQENPPEMTLETIDDLIAVPFKVDAEGGQLFKKREDALLAKLESLPIQGRIEAMLNEIGESFAGFYMMSSKRTLNGEDEIDPVALADKEEMKARIYDEVEIMGWQVEQANTILTEWLATRGRWIWDPEDNDVVESMQFEKWLRSIWPKFLAAERVASLELKQRRLPRRAQDDTKSTT